MLHFDLDADEVARLQRELGATEEQVRLAFNRALSRTAATLRRQSGKGLRSELRLRNLKAIRKRLKQLRMRRTGGRATAGLWFGANDLPVSAFKGRPHQGRRGASFRGVEFPGAFVAKGEDGKLSIFKRKGRDRLPIEEQTMPVEDQITTYVEDEVFPMVDEIFFKHFRADLRARAVLGVGGGR